MEQKNNSGSLYRNENKDKEIKPDYTGKALIGGKEYRIAGWVNKSKSAKSYLRVLFTEIEQKPNATPDGQQARLEMGTGVKDQSGNVDSVMLDDLPF